MFTVLPLAKLWPGAVPVTVTRFPFETGQVVAACVKVTGYVIAVSEVSVFPVAATAVVAGKVFKVKQKLFLFVPLGHDVPNPVIFVVAFIEFGRLKFAWFAPDIVMVEP